MVVLTHPAHSSSGSVLAVFCRPGVYGAAMLAGEGVAILLALAPGVEGDRWVRLGLASLFIQWVVLIWAAGLCMARRSLAIHDPLRLAWVAVLFLLAVSLLVAMGAHALLAGPGVMLGGLPVFLGHVAAIALVVGLMGVMGVYSYWRNRLLALQAKDAELEALHARIQPHFLFNTLNAIASLVPSRPEQAERMVESLAQMLRAALDGPQVVRLADELALVRDYLAIEAIRLEDRLRVRWDLPDPLPEVRVPSLSVQPLVENAVRYGVEPVRDGGEVRITVESLDGWVTLSVHNSYQPELGAHRVSTGRGMALNNVRARLDALFGGQGDMQVMRAEDAFEVRLTLPAQPMEAEG